MLQTYRKSLMGFHFISWTLTLVQGQRSNRYFSGFDILQTITCHVLEIRTTITVKSSKQTSKQTSKHVNKHVNKQTCKQTNKQMNLWKADHRNPGLKAGRRPPEGIGGFQGGGEGVGGYIKIRLPLHKSICCLHVFFLWNKHYQLQNRGMVSYLYLIILIGGIWRGGATMHVLVSNLFHHQDHNSSMFRHIMGNETTF